MADSKVENPPASEDLNGNNTGTANAPPPKAEEAGTTQATAQEPEDPTPSEQTPIQKLAARLPAITEKAGWDEMWSVPLSNNSTDHVPTSIVLQKFLNANNGDVDAAEKQLTEALEWRKRVNPNELLEKASFSRDKFEGLGYVTTHAKGEGKETVVTWNIYGKVKDFKATFGNLEEFIQWRAALMELGVRKLNLPSATVPLGGGNGAGEKVEEDPYRMVQVHDYLDVSFFRMDPHVKAASRETIAQLSTAYPELLSHKYFVNVPAVMGWVFGVMKLFLSPATLRKFHPMSSGASLCAELACDVDGFPAEYGGKGASVTGGETVRLEEAKVEPEAEVPVEESGEQQAAEGGKADQAPGQ